jgi:hypothetical protein
MFYETVDRNKNNPGGYGGSGIETVSSRECYKNLCGRYKYSIVCGHGMSIDWFVFPAGKHTEEEKEVLENKYFEEEEQAKKEKREKEEIQSEIARQKEVIEDFIRLPNKVIKQVIKELTKEN